MPPAPDEGWSTHLRCFDGRGLTRPVAAADNRAVRTPRPLIPSYATVALTAVLLAALALVGCGVRRIAPPDVTPVVRATAGEPRAFRMGFSALPATLTEGGQQSAFDLAAKYGEVLLIQRAPSWSDFLAGATPSSKLRATTAGEREAARGRGLQLFMAIDPFDAADRGRLAGLPPGMEGRDLGDPGLRDAFLAEARYIAVNYRPAYLALGMEVNATYERNPAQYQRFLEVYRAAYDVVKASSPETQVFASFQYEQLLGVIPWEPPHPPRWELLDAYAGKADLLAITTYPSFAFAVARKVPPDYYLQLKARTKLPIAFAAAGFASDPGRDGVNSSTRPEQRRYLQRLLSDADELASPLLLWFVGRDAAYLAAPPYDLVASIGLRDTQDQPKESWAVWEDAAKRPFAAGTPSRTPTPTPGAGG